MIIKKIWEEDGTLFPSELLFDKDKGETETLQLGVVAIKKGEKTTPRTHPDEEEFYIFLKGKARVTIGDQTCEVIPGDTTYVPRNAYHFIEGIEDTEYMYVANYP